MYAYMYQICVDQERGGGAGGPDTPPEKKHKNLGFLSNTGPDPLRIWKLPNRP